MCPGMSVMFRRVLRFRSLNDYEICLATYLVVLRGRDTTDWGHGGACMSNLFGGDTRYTNKGGQVSLELYYTFIVRFALISD